MTSSLLPLASAPHSYVESLGADRSVFVHRLEALEARLSNLPEVQHEVTILATRGDQDALTAALTMAAGAATMGGSAHVFFAFSATAALRRAPPHAHEGSLVQRMFGWMRATGPGAFALSSVRALKSVMMKQRPRTGTIPSLQELIATCAELGVHFHVCSTSMSLLGLTLDDLVDYPGLDLCGVATLAEYARASRWTLTT